MEVSWVLKDNLGLKTTAETYKSQISDMSKEMELLKKTGTDNTEELTTLRAEYHQFRQDNMHADTQIRDLTRNWRLVSEQLETTQADLEETVLKLFEERALTAKLKER
jgi:chromosome segregation ATPase